MSLSKDTVCELFTERDGKLYNKYTRGWQAKAGEQAGSLKHTGYRQVRINSKMYQEHRVVYVIHHGHIPNRLQIDHINGDRADNRIANLRLLTHTQNCQNKKSAKGFSYNKRLNKYSAQLKVKGKQIYLGMFDTKEQAKGAYLEAKKLHHIDDNYRQFTAIS